MAATEERKPVMSSDTHRTGTELHKEIILRKVTDRPSMSCSPPLHLPSSVFTTLLASVKMPNREIDVEVRSAVAPRFAIARQ